MSAWAYPTSTLWMHYFDVFNLLGRMPINGSPYDADCAIALAFGRNSVPDDRLPNVHTCFSSSDSVIAAITHLNRSYADNLDGFYAGGPNHSIADKGIQIIEWYNESDIPLLAQWEIVMTMCQRRGVAWTEHHLDRQKLFCLSPPNRPAYRTIEVLEDAFKITQNKKWKRPVLLAHDCHMPRVAMLAQHFWPEFIIGFPYITSKFDPQSVRPMTTRASEWYKYELKGRAHHFVCGWCFGHFQWGRF